MADIQQKIKNNFARNLKAEEYLTEMAEFWRDIPEMLSFMMVFLHDVFSSGRFKGSKLLELGSGATVHSIASASVYFSDIVMSDYVEDNVKQLKRWLRGDSNLKQFLDIPAELEGYGKNLEAGKRILEFQIRSSVKHVTRCDVLSDNILLEETKSPATSPPFDVIISCLCLEVAPKDVKGYHGILKRINSLLRPGGGVVLCGFLQGGVWNVGDKQFHHIRMSEEELLEGLKKAGFGNIDIKTLGKDGLKEIFFKYDKLFCVAADKM